MSRKYLVWKNPACNGKNVEWLELTGKEFCIMMTSSENKERRFIRLGNDICPEADIIFAEATEVQYKDWKQVQNAHAYLSKVNGTYETVSLDYPIGNTEAVSLYEIIADEASNVEQEATADLLKEKLRLGLKCLSREDVGILFELYVIGKSITQLSKERGVSHQAISKRVSRILSKLKKYF